MCIRLIYFHKLSSIFVSDLFFLYDPIFSIGLFCWACSFVHVYIKMHFIYLKNQSLMTFPCTFWFCLWSFPVQCIKCSQIYQSCFLRFFLRWTNFKVFIEFVTILLLFYVLVFWPQAMWDLSSLTRDWTRGPCIWRWSLNHWTTGEVLVSVF